MEFVNELIRNGYSFNIIGGRLKGKYDGEGEPDKYIAGLLEKVGGNKAAAITYIKTLVTLKVDTQPTGDRDEYNEYELNRVEQLDEWQYRLTVKAFDYDKKPMPELNANITGTIDETGGYLLDNYLESPQFSFVHCLHVNLVKCAGGDYVSVFYLMNNEFGVNVFLPKDIAPQILLDELDGNNG